LLFLGNKILIIILNKIKINHVSELAKLCFSDFKKFTHKIYGKASQIRIINKKELVGDLHQSQMGEESRSATSAARN
jgi:hypothetical protein